MLAVRVGEVMLTSGAEVERVEGLVATVCRASGFPYAECFAIPTGIFVSLGQDSKQSGGDSLPLAGAHPEALRFSSQNLGTILKRVPCTGTDFRKVSEVSRLVQRFAAGEVGLHQCIAQLGSIEQAAHYAWPLRILAVMFVAAFFALMQGGAPVDVVPALVAGVAGWLASVGIENLRINRFIAIFTGSFLAAGVALLFFNLGLGSSLASSIIGAITMFLPGVALTNATRDLVAGDMLSGTARTVESVLIAASIALGVGLLLQLGPAPLYADIRTEHALVLHVVFAALGTAGVCVALNSPRRLVLPTAFIGAFGWGLYEFLMYTGESRIFSCLVSACLVALLAEVAVRLTREPFTLFVIPAIWPLVPGGSMYNGMLQLIHSNYDQAGAFGIEALLVAGSIACALLIVTSLSRVVSRLYTWSFKKRR